MVTIEESDIEEMLDNLRKQRTEYVAVDRAAQNDDQIVVDFLGRLDGDEFEGGKAEKAPLVLGSNAMIPGFESQLVGMKAGDQKTIQVTFPDDYQADHLAGKETEFDITVHEVKESHLPELDEELVKSFGIEDGTIDSLRADIVKNMERELKQRVEATIKSQVMDGLVELNPIEVPASLVAEEIKRQKEQLMQQMPADSDSSMLSDDLFTDQATRRVQLGLVVGEVIQQNETQGWTRQNVRSQGRGNGIKSYEHPQRNSFDWLLCRNPVHACPNVGGGGSWRSRWWNSVLDSASDSN